jgi:hypothetical protein
VDPLIRSEAIPQSSNAYSYSENNPVNGVDPNGTQCFGCQGPSGRPFIFPDHLQSGWEDDEGNRTDKNGNRLDQVPEIVDSCGRMCWPDDVDVGLDDEDKSENDPYTTPVDDEMIRDLDRLEKESQYAQPDPDVHRDEHGIAYRIGEEPVERRGTPRGVKLPDDPRTRAFGHIHTPTPGNARETRANRFPSNGDIRSARNDPYYRFVYVRGTDGRIARLQRADHGWFKRIFTGGVHRKTIRGPVK